MAIVTKATRGAVAGSNNWSSPGDAVSDNGVYAACAPAKKASVQGDWDFAAFTDGELPVGVTINSVTIRANYNVSTTASVASLEIDAGNNGSYDPAEADTSEPTSDANFDVAYNTAPSESDLKTAGRLVARVRGVRGNSNTAVTFALDYIELRVDYSAATVTGTGALAAQSSVLDGAGVGESLGTGTLAVQAVVLDGVGVGESTGTGAFAAQASAVDGAGVASWVASGTLSAQAAVADGAGLSLSEGPGALQAAASILDGSGTVTGGVVTGTGVLVAQSATLDGAGVGLSEGVGVLDAQTVLLDGTGVGVFAGGGALVASNAMLEGVGENSSIGTGVLVGAGIELIGVGDAFWLAVGTLDSLESLLVGTGAVSGGGTGYVWHPNNTVHSGSVSVSPTL